MYKLYMHISSMLCVTVLMIAFLLGVIHATTPGKGLLVRADLASFGSISGD